MAKSANALNFQSLAFPRRTRAMLLALLLAGPGVLAQAVDKRLDDLDLLERQQLYTYGVMASLAYRGDAPGDPALAARAPEPMPDLTEREQAFLRRTGYVCLGAREAWGIRVLGFFNPDRHRLVIAIRGTNLQERSSLILNLISDLGIGRHLTDEEILRSLEDTLRRQREELGHLAPPGPPEGHAPALQATARELAAAAEALEATARVIVPQRVQGETFYQRTLHSAATSSRHAFSLLWGATHGAASQARASAKYGMAGGAGVGTVAAGLLGNPAAGFVGGGLLGGVAAGIAGGASGLVQGGLQAMKDNGTAITLNIITAGDGYYQTLTSLRVADGFARDFIGKVNASASAGVPVTVVYAGHSLGGYLSTVLGTLRGGQVHSFNGPGVTVAKINTIARDLGLPETPPLEEANALRNITTTVLSSDLIGNLGEHDGTLITVRNGDSPFGRNREALRWLRHELHAKVAARMEPHQPVVAEAAAFRHLGAPGLKLDPADGYRKAFKDVALEQHSIKHLLRLLESLEPMAGLVRVHALPLPSPFAPLHPAAPVEAAPEDGYLDPAPASTHRFLVPAPVEPEALPFAGDEIGEEAPKAAEPPR